MIDTEALRKKVIDLAIRGQLTEQLPSDGNAEDLYAKIQNEKDNLIKEGRIKKDKVYSPVTEDEMAFEVPTNWKWVRFSTIISLQSGQDLASDDYNSDNDGIPYITGASNYRDDGELIINRWTTVPKAIARKDDILLSCKGTVGKLTILQEKEVHIARQIMGIKTYQVNNLFIKYFIEWMLEMIKNASKGLIPGIERNDVLNLCCPLPPLAEQNRIVEKINEILSQIDIIDTHQVQYAHDLTVLKSKIIDAGIQGKLTEQLPSDGDAETLYVQIQEEKDEICKLDILKNKKKHTISSVDKSEFPFQIPNNWKWIRLGNVVEVFGRIGFRGYTRNDIVAPHCGAITISPSNIMGDGQTDFSDCTYLSWEKYEESPEIMIENGDILVVKTGSSYGKTGIVKDLPEKATINPQIAVLKYLLCEAKYINYILNSNYAKKRFEEFVVGAAIPTFSQEKLANLVIPLPPLAEQKRIAEKIDAIMEQLG